MNDLNRCTFIGRLVQTPEVRYTTAGDASTSFTLACNWKTSGKEGCEFIRVVAYRKLAEIIGEYMKKGSQMYVEGRMTTRKWQNKEGIDQYSTEIVADQMQMLGHAKGSEDAPQARQAAPRQAKPTAQSVADMDSDIPF